MNILCLGAFSAAWDLHGYVEMGILQALREKKANIINVACDIKSEYCYLYLYCQANCAHCTAMSQNYFADKNMPFIWLSKFARPQDHQRAAAIVDSLDPGIYSEAKYEDLQIGKWALSTFISFLRANAYDCRDPNHVQIFKGLLTYTLETAWALERLLSQGRYDRVIMFNGRLLPFSILLDMAEAKNIPCYLHERGSLPDTYALLLHKNIGNIHPMSILPSREVLEMPLTREQLESTQKIMLQAETANEGLNWHRFSPTIQHDDLSSYLGIEKGKRIWAYFATSEDELRTFPGYEYADFPTQLDGLIRIVQIVSSFPDVHLVIRMHPNSGSKGDKRVPWIDQLTAFLKRRHSANVSIIAADDDVDTYQLMRVAEVGLTTCSSCAGEMLHRGKPAMAFHKLISQNEGIYIAENKEKMLEILNRFHKMDITKAEMKECFRKSLRYKFFLFFRSNIPFEIIKQTSPHTVRPLFSRVEQIKNSHFPILDKVAGQILRGEAISFDYCPETASQGSLAEENAWIDAYMEHWQYD